MGSIQHPTPITLITEAPHETIYGADFMQQHPAQKNAALHTMEIYRSLAAEVPQPFPTA